MRHDIHIGDPVEWNWGAGTGSGTVRERFSSDVIRTIDGTEVTRHSSDDDPAHLVEQDDGDRVLESNSELTVTDG